MTLLVTLLPDGTMEKEVIASVAEGLFAGDSGDMARLRSCFRSPSLQLASYTITEKGYALRDVHGNFLPSVQSDFVNGPDHCFHTMSLTAALLWERFNAGGTPLALVSMDNCSNNGEKLRSSIMTVVEHWLEYGHVSQAFTKWVQEDVTFPWTTEMSIVNAKKI